MANDVITRVTLNLILKKGPFYTILYGHKGPFFELDAKELHILLLGVTWRSEC